MGDLTTQDQPSSAALAVAAAFRPKSLVGAVVGMCGFPIMLAKFWVGMVLVLIGGALFVKSVLRSMNDPALIRQAQANTDLRITGSDAPRLEHVGGGGLEGEFLAGFERAKQLNRSMAQDIKALPEGPGRAEFEALIPGLDEFLQEVHSLAHAGQKLELELSSGVRDNVERELNEVESRLSQVSDPAVVAELEVVRDNKRSTLGHYDKSRGSLEKIKAQLLKIVSSLEEAQARVHALRVSTSTDVQGAATVQKMLVGISNDVKYLSEGVEETQKLLTGPS